MRLSDFDDWARAHHGLLSFEASGLSQAAWYRAIRAGSLIQVHPWTARLPGTPESPEQRIAAGVLAIGEAAMASHRSAARLWCIPRPDDDPVDVIVRGGRRDLALDGVVIHLPVDRHSIRPLRRFGVPCTNILRTLLDLGAVDPAAVADAVGHTLTSKLATLEAIEAAATAYARRGRPGTAVVRDAVDDWSIDNKPSDSLLESAMRTLAARFELPPVEFHPVIEGFEVDFRVIDTPVIIECDGWAYHGLRRDNFERDRRRDADLISAGWVVLRFTYRAITARPTWTAEKIRLAVERWSTSARRDDPPPPEAA